MCADTENDNIVNNCKKFIINNKKSCILNIIKLSENKNTVQNKLVIEKPLNGKSKNTDIKNIVMIIF
jgi:hypothetical protein